MMKCTFWLPEVRGLVICLSTWLFVALELENAYWYIPIHKCCHKFLTVQVGWMFCSSGNSIWLQHHIENLFPDDETHGQVLVQPGIEVRYVPWRLAGTSQASLLVQSTARPGVEALTTAGVSCGSPEVEAHAHLYQRVAGDSVAILAPAQSNVLTQ